MSNDEYQHRNTWVSQQEKKVLEQIQKDVEESMYPKKEKCNTAKTLSDLIKKKNDNKTI